MLQTGDLILTKGLNGSSKILVKAQQVFVPRARSSHVMIAHAETLVLDAAPKNGVRHTFLLDALNNIEPDWIVIRKLGLTEEDQKNILKAGAYYLWQSYMIHPAPIVGKKKSYCSELARKIYGKAGIKTDIPSEGVIMPAHFDLLAADSDEWINVTTGVINWLRQIRSDEERYRAMTKTFIEGIELNRKRFTDREKMRELLEKQAKKGKLSHEKLAESIHILDQINLNVAFKFWDT